MTDINEIIKAFESEYPTYNLVYVTVTGSTLFGTDTPTSDVDYKGIFIPSLDDVILKSDIEHWSYKTAAKKGANTADDVDVEFWSIYKFLHLLKKGETNAVELLFSIHDPHTTVLELPSFTLQLTADDIELLSKKLSAFVGYGVGQIKKYNIKGERYQELVSFVHSALTTKVGTYLRDIMYTMDLSNYKYIKIVRAPGPRGSGSYDDIDYLEVLGKKFSGDVTVEYVAERLQQTIDDFGNRSKQSADGIDYKGLHHGYRVLTEVKELLTTGFLTLPRPDATYLKQIKCGEIALDVVVNQIEALVNEIDVLMETSTILQEKPNEEYYDSLTRQFVLQ